MNAGPVENDGKKKSHSPVTEALNAARSIVSATPPAANTNGIVAVARHVGLSTPKTAYAITIGAKNSHVTFVWTAHANAAPANPTKNARRPLRAAYVRRHIVSR